MNRTKIICTLGPASHTAECIGNLIDAGMNVARLNFSHGDEAFHRQSIALIHDEAAKRQTAVATLMDLPGPKMRVGLFAGGGTDLVVGAPFIITTEQRMGDAQCVSTSYGELPSDVHPGDMILLDDGMLRLQVTRIEAGNVHTKVIVGGRLRDHKGINLPGVSLSAPTITEQDRQYIKLALQLKIDYVAVSFVRSAIDIIEAKQLLTSPDGTRIPVIAKIERPEAVNDLEAIINVTDGLMVARGDLGIELGQEKVPLVQKHAITLANAHGKLNIVATQMMESMTMHPLPTRAEVSDVANAVLDGADALMLSGETAAGDYPALTVSTMAKIIKEVEESPLFRTLNAVQPAANQHSSSAAIAHAATIAARQLDATVIATLSTYGTTARLISSYRPEATIVAFTRREDTFRRLALCWGVHPVLFPKTTSAEIAVTTMAQQLVTDGHAPAGSWAVLTMGVPVGTGEETNIVKVHLL